MYWQGETDAQCSPFRDAASSLLASCEGWKRELIGSSTPTSTLDASHSHLAGTDAIMKATLRRLLRKGVDAYMWAFQRDIVPS